MGKRMATEEHVSLKRYWIRKTGKSGRIWTIYVHKNFLIIENQKEPSSDIMLIGSFDSE